MSQELRHLFHLPNEILVCVISLLRTAELLPLTEVSQRFHYLAVRILHVRLLQAASNPLYKIILEAYLPSIRWSRPDLYCTYLGTDGLSSTTEGEGLMYADCRDEHGKEIFGGRLAKLGGLYSRFRPEWPGVEGKMPVRRIAGAAPSLQSNTSGLQTDWYNAPISDGPGSGSPSSAVTEGPSTSTSAQSPVLPQSDNTFQQGPLQSQLIWSNGGDGGARKIIYDFHFDEDELFGQFCLTASLVRLGPRRGVFHSSLHLCTHKQGVIRVWREWLVERVKNLARSTASLGTQPVNGLQRTYTVLKPEDTVKDPDILWTDYKKNIGLRVLVREKQVEGVPLTSPDASKDDMPLAFDVEVEEFIIRTSRLMLGVEESEEAQSKSGNALIIETVSEVIMHLTNDPNAMKVYGIRQV